MRRAALLIAACVVLVAAGVAHGLRTDRWGSSGDLAAAAARMETLPDRIGDWDGTRREIDPHQFEAAHVAGMSIWKYTHRYTRNEITVLVITGRLGPVSVHTPDVCYSTAGFSAGPNEVRPLPDGGKAWTSMFTNGAEPPESLRIDWTWSDGGEWVASTSPRSTFARSRVLHKLYVIRPVSSPAEPGEEAAEAEFLKALLPELRTRLSPG